MKLRDDKELLERIRYALAPVHGEFKMVSKDAAEAFAGLFLGWADDAVDRALTATGPARHDTLPGLRDALLLLGQRRDKLRGAAARGQENRAERVEASAAVRLIRDQIERVEGAATGPGSGAPYTGPLADVEDCNQCGAKRQGWQHPVEDRCPYHADPTRSCDGILRRRNIAAPQTDHRAAPALPSHDMGCDLLYGGDCARLPACVAREQRQPATPPSGSPPAVTEPPMQPFITSLADVLKREQSAPAAAPGEPHQQPDFHDDGRGMLCDCSMPSRHKRGDGSRGTR